MAMSYGYVYVAQVAMGADPAQTFKLSFPGKAEELYAKAASDAKERLESYENLAK